MRDDSAEIDKAGNTTETKGVSKLSMISGYHLGSVDEPTLLQRSFRRSSQQGQSGRSRVRARGPRLGRERA